MDRCPSVWPIVPGCEQIISFFLYTTLSIANLIVFFLPKGNEYVAVGHLPFNFALAVTLFPVLAGQSVAYVVYTLITHGYSVVVAAFCAVRGLFWCTCLLSFVKWRDRPFLPFSLVASFCLAGIIQCMPLTAWHMYFPDGPTRKAELGFYISESIFVWIVFLSTMILPTRRSEHESTWSNFSRKMSTILPYVWPRGSISLQLRVLVCLGILAIGRVINVALPLYNKWIVDGLAHPLDFNFMLIIVSSGFKFLQGSGAQGSFLNSLRTFLWLPIQQYTTREIQVSLFQHLHNLSLRWHLSRKTGQVLRVMERGTNSINVLLGYLLFNILPTILDIVIAIIFFFSTFDYIFGLLVMTTMFIYLFATIFITEWRSKFRREENEKDNENSAIATDSLLNYETVKYYGNEEYEVDRFRKSLLALQVAEWRTNASLAVLNILQNMIIGVSLLVGSLLIAYTIKNDTSMTVGDYVLFTTYILQLYNPLNFFGTVYRMVQKAFIDMENMFDLLSEDVEVFDATNALSYTPSEGKISVKSLSFGYFPEKKVLEDISFEVSSGQTVALVGPSGSGKSTMIRLLFRLFEAGEGGIEFDGKDVRALKIASFRKQIGIVPQDTVLFNDTIRYNIRFGRPTASDAEVEEAAKAAMIHDKIITLQNGYDTIVGERGLKLSGGEKQRVAIARTVLKQPQFIFLDEATSALDTHTERAIQRCLEEICATRTTVVVAHRLSTIANADLILVLDRGRIIERGTHSSLIADGGVYAHMWESQMAESGGRGSSTGGSPPKPASDRSIVDPEPDPVLPGVGSEVILEDAEPNEVTIPSETQNLLAPGDNKDESHA